jgi:hypothetical protein
MGVQSSIRAGALMAALVATSVRAAEPYSAFGPGEESIYKVEYLGLSAGTARITVGAEVQRGGEPVLPIVTLARSSAMLAFYPVRDKFVTYWDLCHQRTLGSELYADEGNKRRMQKIHLDHAGAKATVTRQKDGEPQPHTAVHDIQPGTLDVASASFALRNLPLSLGAQFDLPIFTGQRSFVMRARVERKERIKTSLGMKDTFKVRVQTGFGGKFESKRDMYAWITDDAQRIPVRIEAEFVLGRLRADLAEYRSGQRIALRAVAKQDSGG